LKADASHLDGLNWEILVVNEPVVNAFCLPGGKIVVFTGLLEHFRTDAEIATIIGHEVYLFCTRFWYFRIVVYYYF
jgi:predicted Zn-dependent protease